MFGLAGPTDTTVGFYPTDESSILSRGAGFLGMGMRIDMNFYSRVNMVIAPLDGFNHKMLKHEHMTWLCDLHELIQWRACGTDVTWKQLRQERLDSIKH